MSAFLTTVFAGFGRRLAYWGAIVGKRSLAVTFRLLSRAAISRLTEIDVGVSRWRLRGSFSGTMA